MSKIYLACPYSHEDPKVLEYRVEQATKAAAKLISEGHIVFSPITHSHPISLVMDNSLDHETWLGQDIAFMDWAEEMCILSIEGWDKSYGVKWEREYMTAQGKRVWHLFL